MQTVLRLRPKDLERDQFLKTDKSINSWATLRDDIGGPIYFLRNQVVSYNIPSSIGLYPWSQKNTLITGTTSLILCKRTELPQET